MKNEIRQIWFFHQPPETVWDYLTQAELLEQWLGKTDIKPVVGHKFRFFSPYGNDCICEMLEVTPFNRLSYSWRKNSAKDNKPFDSNIVWTLVPKDNGTELRLVQHGIRAVEDVAPHEEGWNHCAKMLTELLSGKTTTA